MLVTIIKKDCINSTTLPEKISGQYWLLSNDEYGKNYHLISIEGINGKWYLKSSKFAKVLDSSNSIIKTQILDTMSFCSVLIQNSNEKAFVFTEPLTENRQKFTKYVANQDLEINIGRAEDNQIVFASRFVSSYHASLIFKGNQWSIKDIKSTNGTYVNGYRIQSQTLLPGDVVYIMGLKIIIGNDFFAINKPDEMVVLKSNVVIPYVKQPVFSFDEEDEGVCDSTNIEYYYRSPRFKRGIEKKDIRVDSPPDNAIGDEIPIMFLLGPSITMGMASLASGVFAINNAMSRGNINSAIPSIVMSLSMLLGTVLWPILSKSYDKRKRRRKEALRQKKYTEYIGDIYVALNDEYVKQKDILLENYVHISDCVKRIKGVERNLWERGPGQDDFLKLRLGLGNTKMDVNIIYTQRRFTLTDDNLMEKMYDLCESPKILEEIPITLSLFEDFISGVIGERNITKEFAKGLIFQLSALYSYDEVKMVFIYDSDEEQDFKFTKWLPHVWSDDKKIRLIATVDTEIKEVSAYIDDIIKTRSEINESEIADTTPYYAIFAFSRKLALRSEMLKQLYTKKMNINISVITFFDELKNLPKECSTVIELDERTGRVFDKNDISGRETPFVRDIFTNTDTVDLSIKLANVQLDMMQKSLNLPSMITFLELFGVGKVEHLNSLTRWKENDPTKTLEVEIGVDTYGDVLKLDLHEKFHGPHGLVAGMTGSGKSEFIISYILSLAVNYHPYEVAFILIDYKGGGMAKAFENLPHTMGIITNLDGAAVKRSLVSIESELKRRQGIFAQVSKTSGISNIDIYKYQKMYREGSVNKPLQHLFIISDEFAELKTQQREFMEQLVSAARIGRSLGIHLILATQKPAGVVDDQIWSNSKFRVCLKVQERSDSMDMLKRPDAAELSHTGRFYLQVGYNELFELGQSAWAGAPYYPAEKVVVEKDNSIVVVDRTGRTIKQLKMENKAGRALNPRKQLDAITEYLNTIANEENIKVRPLWLEPIPQFIYLDKVKEKYNYKPEKSHELNPVIGEFDDPVKQSQCILTLPISQEGNAVIYGSAESGKTTFLTTMVYSLIKEHTPDVVNIYILDFASETLKAFSKAPHIGDVILSYECEKVSNLFKYLLSEIDKRKKLFADCGGDLKSYMHMTGENIPSIVVVINNFAAFTEIYEEKEEAVSYLTREGTKYGVYFVLTAIGTGAIRMRMLQNFKQLIMLQLNDESDYSIVVGKTNGLFPSKYKGRGLVKRDSLYEFQVAYVTEEKMPLNYIQNFCKELHSNWKGKGKVAKKIPILPDKVDLEFISDYVTNKNSLSIPIGVEKNTLEVHYYPYGSSYINMVLSSGNDNVGFVYSISLLMRQKCRFDVTIFDALQSYTQENTSTFKYYYREKDCEEALEELFNLVVYRHNTTKDALEKGEAVEIFEQKIIIFNSVSALNGMLSDKCKERLGLILERGDAKFNITIIIAETSKNIPGISFEKWYKKQVSPTDGIWVGNGFSEQYYLKASKTTSEMREEINNKFGYSLRNGRAVRIKLFNIMKEEDE